MAMPMDWITKGRACWCPMCARRSGTWEQTAVLVPANSGMVFRNLDVDVMDDVYFVCKVPGDVARSCGLKCYGIFGCCFHNQCGIVLCNHALDFVFDLSIRQAVFLTERADDRFLDLVVKFSCLILKQFLFLFLFCFFSCWF